MIQFDSCFSNGLNPPTSFSFWVFVYHACDQRLETLRHLCLPPFWSVFFVCLHVWVGPLLQWWEHDYIQDLFWSLELFFPLTKAPHQFLGYPPIRLQRFFHLEKRGRKIHLGTPCWSGSTTLAVSATAFWQARSGFFRPQQKREEFDVFIGHWAQSVGKFRF